MKRLDPLWLPHYAAFVWRASRDDARLAELFAPDAVLVPVPSSGPMRDVRWTALQLALTLRSLGLGGHVWTGLRRAITVRKSATAPTAARPSVRAHYQSFAVDVPALPIQRVVLIDDVITRGRTALAAAARLRTGLPGVDIRAFALIRTLGFANRLERLIECCHGVVRWAGGDARRVP